MHKSKLILSLLIFIILMIFTSAIKTQKRKIEKNIIKLENEIVKIKNMLHESQIDFSYLSSPEYISKKINEFSDGKYFPIDYSKIYLSYEDYLYQYKKTSQK